MRKNNSMKNETRTKLYFQATNEEQNILSLALLLNNKGHQQKCPPLKFTVDINNVRIQ